MSRRFGSLSDGVKSRWVLSLLTKLLKQYNELYEYMVYCRSRQLREKTMASYEKALRLFERWRNETMGIGTVDKVTELEPRPLTNFMR